MNHVFRGIHLKNTSIVGSRIVTLCGKHADDAVIADRLVVDGELLAYRPHDRDEWVASAGVFCPHCRKRAENAGLGPWGRAGAEDA